MATARSVRSELSLTFKEIYRAEQLRMGLLGPIFIYAAAHTLSFLRGCADHRACKILSFTRLLQVRENKRRLMFPPSGTLRTLSDIPMQDTGVNLLKTIPGPTTPPSIRPLYHKSKLFLR